jgi:hypothetical protein
VNVSGKAASADTMTAEEFLNLFGEIIEEGGYMPEQVANADETGLFWKRMPDSAYSVKEEKSVPGFKVNKDHLTLLVKMQWGQGLQIKPFLCVLMYKRKREVVNVTVCVFFLYLCWNKWFLFLYVSKPHFQLNPFYTHISLCVCKLSQ